MLIETTFDPRDKNSDATILPVDQDTLGNESTEDEDLQEDSDVDQDLERDGDDL